MRPKLILVGLLAGLGTLAWLGAPLFAGAPATDPAAGTPPGAAPRSGSRAWTVRTIRAQEVDHFVTTERYSGEVRAARTVEVGFEIPGLVAEVAIDAGDRVETGAVLARLDASRLEARLAGLEAQRDAAQARLDELEAGPRAERIAAASARVRSLEAQLALAEIRTERRRELRARDAVAVEELDASEAEVATLDATLAASRAELEELENGTRPEVLATQAALVAQIDAEVNATRLDLEDCVLRAPFTGWIAVRHVVHGAVVAAGHPAVRLVEEDGPEVWIGVPPDVATDLITAPPTEVEVGGASIPVVGLRVLPELDTRTRTSTVLLELDGTAGPDLQTGRIARLAVPRRQAAEGFWVPVQSLTEGTRGLWSCSVVRGEDGEEVAGRADVEILHAEGDRVFVRGTLRTGDRVITAAPDRTVPGQRVTPVDDED